MSLHLLSKIELNKINKNVKILYFDEKSKYILKKINPTPEFIFGLIILLVKNFLKIKELSKKNIWEPKNTAKYSFEKNAFIIYTRHCGLW